MLKQVQLGPVQTQILLLVGPSKNELDDNNEPQILLQAQLPLNEFTGIIHWYEVPPPGKPD